MQNTKNRPGEYRLTEYFDLDNLQRLQDSLSNATNTASIIADPSGNSITRPSNFRRICEIVRSTPEGAKRCGLSDVIRNKKAALSIEPVYHRCRSCGLMDASAPILIGDDVVANWLLGQCRVGDISCQWIEEYAKEIGADIDEMLSALAKVPEMTIEQFESVLELLGAITNEISQQAHRNQLLSREIALRKRVEDELSSSEHRFRKIVETTPLGIHMYRLEDDNQLIFEGANLAADRILGVKNQEFVGKTIEEAFPPIKATEIPNAYRKAAAEGKTFHSEQIEYEHDQIKGAYKVTAFQTAPGRVAALFDDITERKRAEAMLRDSERRYRELVDTVMEGVGITDLTGGLVYVNRAAAEMIGLEDPEKLLSKSIFDLFPKREHEKIKSKMKERSRGARSSYELEVDLDDGTTKCVLVSASPRLDQDGNHIGSVATLLDITETKRLQKQSERAARLEAAGRIAAQVAHDFNNLLGPLLSYPALLREYVEGNADASAMLSDIQSAASRIADINNDLLSLGRRETKSRDIVDLKSLADETLRHLTDIPENIRIKNYADPRVSRVAGSKSQLFRVLSNLIYNAADSLESGGKIFIDAKDVTIADHKHGIESIPPGPFVALSVRDSGPGIPEEILPRIFEPFFTTKSSDSRRGTGLGLSVVHALVKDHGGYIDCTTAIGEGTCFTVYLPQAGSKSRVAVADSSCTGSERVLVVDDEPEQRSLMKKTLERYGYSVRCAQSGEMAVKLADEFAPDILVLDMMMKPGIDGAETYRLVREHIPEVRAIVVSGYADSDSVERARSEGIEFILRKPVSPSKLLRALRLALNAKPEDVLR